MARINSAMLDLLSSLSPEAREAIAISDTELSARMARTRLIIEQAGRAKTPIHWLNKKLEPHTYLDRPPRLANVPAQWSDVFEELNFCGSIVYEVMGVTVETWTGPDGFVELEIGLGKVYLTAIFEDHQRIRMFVRDAVAEQMAENDPEAITIWQSEDSRSDYRRMLEACASYMLGANTRPMYRYNDLALAQALGEYTDTHAINTEKAKYLLFMKPLSAAMMLAEKFGKNLTNQASPMHKYPWPVIVREDGVRVTCECGKDNRIPHEKLEAKAKCGRCSEPLATLRFPLVVESEVGYNRIIKTAKIPIVVDFWAPWCGPCLFAVPELRKAAQESNDQFAILWVNSDDYQSLSNGFDVRSIPTAIRILESKETHRHMGVMKASEVSTFALSGSPS